MREKIIQGLKWNTINQLFSLGSKFLVTIVLSRLLDPSDFGLTAMIFAFTVVADVLIDAGFKSSIVQEQLITDCELSSIFILNISIGLFFTGAIILAAPFIADFYNEPILESLAIAVAFIYTLNPMSLVHEALLTKELKFKALTLSQVVSKTSAAIIGIYLAYTGWSYWSLVYSSLAGSLFRSMLLWYKCEWRPSFHFRISELRKYWKVSSNILYSNVLFNIVNRVDYVIIGKYFTPSVLGMYSRSKENAFIPGSIIANVIRNTFFGIFSNLKNDTVRLKGLYLNASHLILVSLSIVFSFFIVYAKEIILIVFGSKWLVMTLMFQCYCAYVFIYCNTILRVYLLNALGRTDIDFRMGLVFHPLRLVILLLPLAWVGTINVYYFIIVNSAFVLTGLFIYDYFIKELIDVRMGESLEYLPIVVFYSLLTVAVVNFVEYDTIFKVIVAKGLVFVLGSVFILGLYRRKLSPLIVLAFNKNV